MRSQSGAEDDRKGASASHDRSHLPAAAGTAFPLSPGLVESATPPGLELARVKEYCSCMLCGERLTVHRDGLLGYTQ
jgi:hypothetical protein